jgi:hypothetical protein
MFPFGKRGNDALSRRLIGITIPKWRLVMELSGKKIAILATHGFDAKRSAA